MTRTDNEFNDIAVIGAGAAGLMCASVASRNGAKVTVFEKNSSKVKLEKDRFFDNAYLGKKLLITGKGRCNLTNDCSVEDFLKNVPENPKFLYSALKSFGPSDTMSFFEEYGCPVKVERGSRVFPVSDKSRDVLEALKFSIEKNNCRFINSTVSSVSLVDGKYKIVCNDRKEYFFKKVIICTGGLSYPVTGSTGDGYEFAKSLGHSVKDVRGSLVPVELSGNLHTRLQGLSLRNVTLTLFDKKNKKIFSELGEMLFTHFGASGPLILSCSSHMRQLPSDYRIEIDLKPGLDEASLETRVISDFQKYINRDIDNALCDLLPSKLISPFVEMCEISHSTKINLLKKEQRKKLVYMLKHFPLEIKCLRPVSEAIITSGGIPVKEINPSTMESKISQGLYFAGEIIDVDAYTGGFNLQIAFSSGYLAAISACESI